MTPKRWLLVSTVLAPLTMPAPASAEKSELSAKLDEARNCLAFLGSLRDNPGFRELSMEGLMRGIATSIDYAETWAPLDANRAETYLADCDEAISAWTEARLQTATAAPAAAAAPIAYGLAAAPATARAATIDPRVLQVMTGTFARRSALQQASSALPSREDQRRWER